MNTFFYYTPYYLLTMFFISSIATGIIFTNYKNKENALIFTAFVIYTVTLLLNTFFGYSASIDVENNITTEVKGFLSINQTQLLQLISTLFFSIGFGIKAYKIVKKT